MGKSLVVTTAAMEGIDATENLDVHIFDRPQDWVVTILDALANGTLPGYSVKNREFVRQRYGWERNLNRFKPLLEGW